MLNSKNKLNYGTSLQRFSSWSSITSRLSYQSRRNPSLIMRCLYDGVHPCGKCPHCLANRQRAFMFRLDQEKENATFYYWLTLQYSDEFVPRLQSGEMCFSKEHCRRLFETLRKRYKKQNYTFKHFLVSEYGPNATHRPHYHCLLLVYSEDQKKIKQLIKDRNDMREFIRETWFYGHVEEKSYHGRVLSYLTKYCCKPEMIGEYHEMKPFTLISPGIGKCYVDKLTADQKQYMIDNMDFSVRYGSGKMQLPRYIVDKIFPHSKQDLLDSVDIKDMSQYRDIMFARQKKDKLHLTLQKQKLQGEEAQYSSISDLVRAKEQNRNQVFAEFRSNLKNRKNI